MAKPKIFFYHDGRHPHIYRYEPPMHKEEYVALVDELAGTTIDAIAFCLGEGRTMLHDTRAGELMGHNVDAWGHLVFRRASQNARHLIEIGQDPLRIVCERTHELGMQIYPTLQVQRGGVDHASDRCSDFRKNNQHLEIGANEGVDPESEGADGLDMKHEAARSERFAIIEEVVTEYPVDGFELQLNHMPYFFHPQEVDAGRTIMTDWIGQVSEALKKGGSERELIVHIPDRIEDCLSAGLDPEEWVKRGLVDAISPEMFGENYWMKMDADYKEFIHLTEGTPCRVIGVISGMVMSDRLLDAPISMLRALACHSWDQGVDALYLTEFFHHWPYEAPFYENLRELPHPGIMASKDKFYAVPTNSYQNSMDSPRNPLPTRLELDRPVDIPLSITDDLPRWSEVGRVHEVLLRLRIHGNVETDGIEIRLNGQLLPDSLLRKINQQYIMDAPRYRVMGGYWHIYKLGADCWPKKGDNRLQVVLLARDADIRSQLCTVTDVELEIKYLKGKNFHRSFIDPDLGPVDARSI